MGTVEQVDFSGGIYRGRNAPQGSVYDAINALVDDENQLFRRGGSVFLGPAADEAMTMVYDGHMQPGRRTVGIGTKWHVLDSADATVTNMTSLNGYVPVANSRAASFGNMMVFRGFKSGSTSFPLLAYGGSLKPRYTTGTENFTAGSTTVVGTGTAYLANVDVGMSRTTTGGLGRPPTVASITDDTHLELSDPWPATVASSTDWLPIVDNYVPLGKLKPTALTVAGNRVLLTNGNRVYLGGLGKAFSFATATDYLELAGDAQTIGAEGVGDAALVFTTSGVWEITNLELDLVDDFGNQQPTVRQIAKGVILWGDAGIAAWEGQVVVPTIEAVYLMSPNGAMEPVSGDVWNEKINPLYRSYVKAGYQPGLASVYRAHYVLPILNGSTLVDVLVCRLDKGVWIRRHLVPGVWTRWSGHAACVSYTQRLGDQTQQPKLLAVNGTRFLDLTDAFTVPGAASDADGTTHAFTVDSSDTDTGPGIRPNTTEKLRFTYETTGGTPTVSASTSTGPVGSTYVAATLKRGGGASDGTDYSAWRVGRKTERIRWRFQCSSAVTSLILRRAELTIRGAAQN